MLRKGNNKLIKSFNKVRYVGKIYTLINVSFYNRVYGNIQSINDKTRVWLFRQMAKKRLVVNYRIFVLYKISLKNIELFNDVLLSFFYFFKYPVIKSLSYYKMTDYQLELIRRLARRLFGKKVCVNILIKAYKTLLRRTNQVRMGGGKGSKVYKVIYPLIPGSSVIEVRGIQSIKILNLFVKLINKKLDGVFKLVFYHRF